MIPVSIVSRTDPRDRDEMAGARVSTERYRQTLAASATRERVSRVSRARIRGYSHEIAAGNCRIGQGILIGWVLGTEFATGWSPPPERLRQPTGRATVTCAQASRTVVRSLYTSFGLQKCANERIPDPCRSVLKSRLPPHVHRDKCAGRIDRRREPVLPAVNLATVRRAPGAAATGASRMRVISR